MYTMHQDLKEFCGSLSSDVGLVDVLEGCFAIELIDLCFGI